MVIIYAMLSGSQFAFMFKFTTGTFYAIPIKKQQKVGFSEGGRECNKSHDDKKRDDILISLYLF